MPETNTTDRSAILQRVKLFLQGVADDKCLYSAGAEELLEELESLEDEDDRPQ